MIAKAAPIKVKEIVKLRQKELANGNVSLYLDIYWEGEREYDFLKLYLSAGTTTIERKQNKATMELAEQIKAQRLIDLQNGKYKINRASPEQSFIEFYLKIMRDRKNSESQSNYKNWLSASKHLIAFAGGKEIMFQDVDEAWLNRYKKYLLTDAKARYGERLSQNSAYSYYNKIKATLRQAHEELIIQYNPAGRVKSIAQGESKREFLTWPEVEKLRKTPCDKPVLKQAFLFSILTGLRFCDIKKMVWSEIHEDEKGGWTLRFQQKKTKEFEVLPLNPKACEFMGKRAAPENRVFPTLRYSAYQSKSFAKWILSAGILRNITFHCGRHTHATLLLSQGVDLYVVSKLLGHKHIKTTERYTKVTNIKKNEAVNMLPEFSV